MAGGLKITWIDLQSFNVLQRVALTFLRHSLGPFAHRVCKLGASLLVDSSQFQLVDIVFPELGQRSRDIAIVSIVLFACQILRLHL